MVYSDAFKSYDVLDVSEFHHMRIDHTKLFVDQRHYISGTRKVLQPGQASPQRLQRDPRQHFHLFIKECEWRLNSRPVRRIQSTLPPMVVQVIQVTLSLSAP